MPKELKARVLTRPEIDSKLRTTKNKQLVVFGADGKVIEKLGEIQQVKPKSFNE